MEGVRTPQLEHPQLEQSPEQEQVEQLQGDMSSINELGVGLWIALVAVYRCGSRTIHMGKVCLG